MPLAFVSLLARPQLSCLHLFAPFAAEALKGDLQVLCDQFQMLRFRCCCRSGELHTQTHPVKCYFLHAGNLRLLLSVLRAARCLGAVWRAHCKLECIMFACLGGGVWQAGQAGFERDTARPVHSMKAAAAAAAARARESSPAALGSLPRALASPCPRCVCAAPLVISLVLHTTSSDKSREHPRLTGSCPFRPLQPPSGPCESSQQR